MCLADIKKRPFSLEKDLLNVVVQTLFITQYFFRDLKRIADLNLN
jgi:hypothetical protein